MDDDIHTWIFLFVILTFAGVAWMIWKQQRHEEKLLSLETKMHQLHKTSSSHTSTLEKIRHAFSY